MYSHRAWYERKIETIDEVKKILADSKRMTTHLSSPFFYRGQADSNWMITSKFYRCFQKTFDMPVINTFEDLEKYQTDTFDYSSLNHFHNSLIRSFIQQISMNEKFQKINLLIDLNTYLALAQHYGIPTNLIDFTNSMEVALFFCFDNDEDIKSDYAALYRTNSSLFLSQTLSGIQQSHFINDKEANKLKKLFTTFDFKTTCPLIPIFNNSFFFINTRMKMQQGTFFYNPNVMPYDIIMYRLKQMMHGDFETRFLINRKLKTNVLEYLSTLGINKDTIYPRQDEDPFRDIFLECSKKAMHEIIT